MSSPATPISGEGRLWAASFLVSLLLNVLLFGALAKVSSLDAARHAKTLAEARPAVEDRWVAAVIPERSAAAAATTSTTTAPRSPEARLTPFAHTSPEQESDRPVAARFMGERNTQATSDRAPDANAPPMPSQKGVEDDRFLETTESRYRDGELAGGSEVSPTEPPPPAAPSQSETAQEAKPAGAGEMNDSPGKESASSPPPAQERLAEGPNPVEIEVQAKTKPEDSLKRAPSQKAVEAKPVEQMAQQAATTPEPPVKPVTKLSQPAFAGNQKKTQIRGSISRRGNSALDVEDSPLGRYQAIISRAVEREWQRNCVKYRDLITPGFLTVRFVVESSGKVRSVGFVEADYSGEHQKGFTLNSIREAEIPKMPAELKKQLGDEPLELIFNFYF
jgi:hypothetical protein